MADDIGSHQQAIFVVDDDEGSRTLISSVLAGAGYATREMVSGEEAIEAARRERPLLVLLDVRLPGLSGYEVCGWLRDKFRESVPIIFVSGERTEAFDRAAGLMLGADDYLVKPFAMEELIARVRGLLRRTLSVPRVVAAKLTVRELEVLRLLAGGLGQTEIAGELTISSKTVATHIEHILMKLGVQSRAQAVALAYRDHLLESSERGFASAAASPRAPEIDRGLPRSTSGGHVSPRTNN